MEIVAYDNRWRACAVAETIDWFEREIAVGAGLSEFNSKAGLYMRREGDRAHRLA